MPNWCNNDLTVRGPATEIAAFKSAVAGVDDEGKPTVLDAEKILPSPEGASVQWQYDNWGAKWGFVEPDIAGESPREIVYTFASAWSPPIKLVEKLGQMFPNLYFALNYDEPSEAFEGNLAIENGEVIQDESRDMVICEECGYREQECECEGGPVTETSKREKAEKFEEKWKKKSMPNLDYKILKWGLEEKKFSLRDIEYDANTSTKELAGMLNKLEDMFSALSASEQERASQMIQDINAIIARNAMKNDTQRPEERRSFVISMMVVEAQDVML